MDDREPPPETLVERDVMVAMRDGVRLATDVYRPAGPGRWPAIVERTPYDKSGESRSEIDRVLARPLTRPELARRFAARGFAVVMQDCRGRHRSEGRFAKYLSEGEDGFDTLAWTKAQPWCDGRIGTMGLSYAAHTQVAAACLDPPGLAGMVVDSGGFSNAFQGGIRQGGAFELKQATWAFKQARESPEAAADPTIAAALAAEDIRAWFRRMPWRRGHSPLRHVPEYEAYLLEQWTHGIFDDYWRKLGIYAEGFYDRFADAPMTLMSSWYDAYVRTTIDNFLGLGARKRGPLELIMGPWLHGDRNVTHSGDVEFGPASAFDGNLAEDWIAFRLERFDRWLKGKPGGAREPKVRLFLMGGGSGGRDAAGRLEHGGRWISGETWPPAGTRSAPYYLHGDGSLSPTPPKRGVAPLAYDYDPADPTPTIGGALTSGQPIFAGGAFDQVEGERFFGCRNSGLPLAARPDVLVFETAPLAVDTAAVGPISVRLYVSSDAPDTDFTVKLIDVHPPSAAWPRGFAMNLTDGILRCRYRASWERAEPMRAGEVAEIVVEAFATCNLFKRGHRIRLDVSSSNFPKYDVNPNTFEPEGRSRRRRVAINAVFVDADRPSHVVLPIAPL